MKGLREALAREWQRDPLSLLMFSGVIAMVPIMIVLGILAIVFVVGQVMS